MREGVQVILESVLFVHSDQPVIDRGWDPRDVRVYLQDRGIQVSDVFVRSPARAREVIAKVPRGCLVWPTCYTIGADYSGILLASLLEEANLPFIGASSKSLRYSSKINLKEKLIAYSIGTPAFSLLESPDFCCDIDISVPFMLKCEYSCNSEGVAVVRDRAEAKLIWNALSGKYHQRIFAEEWSRFREFTVAYIPGNRTPIFGFAEMKIVSGDDYITAEVKAKNEYITFELPGQEMLVRLEALASRLVASLGIDGHFRVDILQDKHDSLKVIDLNFLAQLHLDEQELSYFPLAIKLNNGFSPEQTIEAVVSSAAQKFGLQLWPKY